ncbi:MAG: T9SS type A sorting domain-containing protein [Weeksellaceae bacterium]|jgi:hypothetical protein|nr:T9SS type A sorting domain-containing protein [Weeksellaceae bacterium]
MRKLLFFLMFLFVQILLAQEEIILNNIWYLQSMENECSPGSLGENDEFDIHNIQLTFTQEGEVIYFHSEMCKELIGTVEITAETIEFKDLSTSGEACFGELTYYYEQAYECALSALYNYEIIENTDGLFEISMENEIFMSMSLTTHHLKTADIEENNIKIWPNPTKDYVIIADSKNKITAIRILDVSGNLINQVKVNSKTKKIDLQSLPSGVYFFVIESASATPFKKKVLKE